MTTHIFLLRNDHCKVVDLSVLFGEHGRIVVELRKFITVIKIIIITKLLFYYKLDTFTTNSLDPCRSTEGKLLAAIFRIVLSHSVFCHHYLAKWVENKLTRHSNRYGDHFALTLRLARSHSHDYCARESVVRVTGQFVESGRDQRSNYRPQRSEINSLVRILILQHDSRCALVPTVGGARVPEQWIGIRFRMKNMCIHFASSLETLDMYSKSRYKIFSNL